MAVFRKVRSPHLRKKRREEWLVAALLGVALTLSVAALVSEVFKMRFWTIADIAVDGTRQLSEETLHRIVADEIIGTYLWLFPKRNVALVPRGSIKRALLEYSPRIREVDIDTESLTAFSVAIHERQPFGIWCATVHSAQCFFLDESGFIFAPSAMFSQTLFPMFYGGLVEEEASTTPFRSRFLPEQKFRQVTRLFTTLADTLSLEPRALAKETESTFALHEESGLRILFNDTDDFSALVRDIAAVFRSEALQTDSGALRDVDYIDMRFGNKVFFKVNQ